MELGFEGCRVWKSGSGGLRAAVLVFLLSGFSVYSQNLVQNGDFSANGGSFEGWNISHSGGGTNYPNEFPIVSGTGGENPGGANYYAQFLAEDNFSSDVLSQDISTIPGDIYLVSFYAEDGAGHNFATDFSFGNFSYDLGNAFAIGPGEWWRGWTNFNFMVTATQSLSDLSFLIHADNGSEFGVTGISVTAVTQPELQEALVGGKFQVTVTNSTSQVVIQASTNLIDWVNVCTNTAPCTITNDCSMPQRFFRVAMRAQVTQ
jgi:hypothetical protein